MTRKLNFYNMPITVRLGSDVEKRLDTLAKLTGRTKNLLYPPSP